MPSGKLDILAKVVLLVDQVAACWYNTGCTHIYGGPQVAGSWEGDVQDQCFMRANFPEMTNEAFCYDGACRPKQSLGQNCLNSAGNHDNNNCVTGHCQDTCQFREEGCRSFANCIQQGQVDNSAIADVAAAMIECYNTVSGVGEYEALGNPEGCRGPGRCRTKYLARSPPGRPQTAQVSVRSSGRRGGARQLRAFVPPAAKGDHKAVSQDGVASGSIPVPVANSSGPTAARQLQSFSSQMSRTIGETTVGLEGSVTLERVVSDSEISLSDLSFTFSLSITLVLELTITVQGTVGVAQTWDNVYKLSHLNGPCGTAASGGDNCSPFTIFRHNPRVGKIPVFLEILSQLVAQLNVELTADAEFWGEVVVQRTITLEPVVTIDVRNPSASSIRILPDSMSNFGVNFQISGGASCTARLRIGPQLTLRVEGFQFHVFAGVQIDSNADVNGVVETGSGTCLHGEARVGGKVILGLQTPAVDIRKTVDTSCNIAMNYAGTPRDQRRLQNFTSPRRLWLLDAIFGGDQETTCDIPDDVQTCMMNKQREFCQHDQCCLTLNEFLLQVLGENPWCSAAADCGRSICGTVTDVLMTIIPNAELVSQWGRCWHFDLAEEQALMLAGNQGQCPVPDAAIDYGCGESEYFVAPLDPPYGCSGVGVANLARPLQIARWSIGAALASAVLALSRVG